MIRLIKRVISSIQKTVNFERALKHKLFYQKTPKMKVGMRIKSRIIDFIKRLTCRHDWFNAYVYADKLSPKYQVVHLEFCQKCGKEIHIVAYVEITALDAKAVAYKLNRQMDQEKKYREEVIIKTREPSKLLDKILEVKK